MQERMWSGHLGCYNLVLQFLRGAMRYWDEETLANIIKDCIIMHNMIIENEGAMNIVFDHEREVNSFILVSYND